MKHAILKALLFFLPLPVIGGTTDRPTLSSQNYTIQSQYLAQPELAIGYVDSSASFWNSAYDNQRGGFYSDIDRTGQPFGTGKHLISQTRNAYGFVRAFMLTGTQKHLEMAQKALDFMYEFAWDNDHGGWYGGLTATGAPVNALADRTAFDQHYALLGIAAMVEATQDSLHWQWLMRGFDHLESAYWDESNGQEGYYDIAAFDNSNARDKSFNATVDAVTTHLLYLYLMTEDDIFRLRLEALAAEMIEHLVGSMPGQAIGFVEKFDSDWNWDNNETRTIMGHVLKTGWCLGRIYQLNPKTEYIDNAEVLIRHVYNNGYDRRLGGPYKDYNRINGSMLFYGLADTAKAWWQMEQAFTGGLELFDITGDSLYLRIADETLDFFMAHFVDREYGEVYADRTRTGDIAYNELKGSSSKAGYHSTELGYYAYLYGNLFVHRKPVSLHYHFQASDQARDLHMTPISIADGNLRILEVRHDGQFYADFDANDRILTLPAGIGGHFVVTYERADLPSSNQRPLVLNRIDDLLLVEEGDPFTRDLTAEPLVFMDPDGDTLSFSAHSNELAVAVATISQNILLVTPEAPGETLISITANDNKGGEITTSFLAIVEAKLRRPALFLPVNGATGVDTSTVLAWTAIAIASSYQVQTGTVADFSDSVFVDTLIDEAAFKVEGLSRGSTYYWRVRAVSSHQVSDWSEIWQFETEPVVTSVGPDLLVPKQVILGQNYPNPFNPVTAIEFALPAAGHVRLTVYDMLGRRVAELVNGFRAKGFHKAIFDATGLATGVYLYRLQAPGYLQTRKMLLTK